MDIAIASNFERLLFDLCNKSTSETSAKMIELDEAKRFSLNNSQVNKAKNIFDSKKVSQEEAEVIKILYNKFDYINPAQTVQDDMVKYGWIEDDNAEFILSTAHPIKFSETVEKAIGRSMDEHEEYADMFSPDFKYHNLDNSTNKVKEIIKSNYNR